MSFLNPNLIQSIFVIQFFDYMLLVFIVRISFLEHICIVLFY